MNIDSDVSPPEYRGLAGQRIAIRHELNQSEAQATLTPSGDAPTHVVFCGGFHSSMLGAKANSLASLCQAEQWSFTRFDYRGHGESDGEPNAYHLRDWLDDTLSILDNLTSPVVLIGSSMGAWLATVAAIRRPNKVSGLLLLAAAPDFIQELVQPRLTAADQWELMQGNTIGIPNDYAQPHPLTQRLIDSAAELSLLDNNELSLEHRISTLQCPIRLIHGTADTDVPVALASRLLERVSHTDAELILLHKVDHRLSDPRSLARINQVLVDLVHSVTSVDSTKPVIS